VPGILAHLQPHLRKGLCGAFDEPYGVSASNDDTDNNPIHAKKSESKITHTSSTPDPLRTTARPTIAKPTSTKITIAAKKIQRSIKFKSGIQDSEDEAEKRRERVRKCRRKKKAKKEEDLLKKEALVVDNNRMEANIAMMNQLLAQMNEILAAHNRAQPDSPLPSLLEEVSQPDVSNDLFSVSSFSGETPQPDVSFVTSSVSSALEETPQPDVSFDFSSFSSFLEETPQPDLSSFPSFPEEMSQPDSFDISLFFQ